MASVHVLGDFSLRADCKATLSCCSDVRKATSVTNPRAHLWLRVHGREEFQHFSCQHVPAHCSMVDVRDGK
eukprot:1064294-Pyramimonas_sp.AAC.1